MNKVQLKYYNKRIKMIHKLMKKMSDLYFIDNDKLFYLIAYKLIGSAFI